MKKSINKYLIETIKNKKYYIYLLTIISFINGLTGVVNAFVLRSLINSAVNKDFSLLKKYGILLIVISIIWISLKAIEKQTREKASSTYENLFKERLFKNILERKYDKIINIHSGEWMNKLTNDTVVIANGLINILPGLIGMIVMLTAALIAIIYLMPKIIILIIPCGIILVFFTYFFRKKLKAMHKRIQESDGKLRIYLQERISNLLIVKAFSKEIESLNEANLYMANHQKRRIERITFSNICNVGFSFLMRFLYIANALYCAYGIYLGEISYGTFVAIIQLVSQIQAPLANITGFVPQYYALLSSCERLLEVEEYELEGNQYDEEAIKEYYDHKFKVLGLKNVNFAYDENNKVLKNFDLELKKGQIIVLAGKSGIGKSTILKLLMNLYETDGLYIDDDILDIRYRKLFSYVPQGNQLLSGTIREIVSFNRPIDEDRINEALNIACCKEFVQDLDQTLGEKGSGLSEGQIQRLAIARAIYSDRPIILLDEATSSLDDKTEKQLLNNIHSLTNKSIIIVTHKKAAKELADGIYNI